MDDLIKRMERPVVLLEDIDSAPSIEIIRCRECKWSKANGTYQWCGRLDSTAKITADDFCSYGCKVSEIPTVRKERASRCIDVQSAVSI